MGIILEVVEFVVVEPVVDALPVLSGDDALRVVELDAIGLGAVVVAPVGGLLAFEEWLEALARESLR